MNGLETLAACAGRWRGTSTLQDPMRGVAEESRSDMEVTPVLGGTFVRVDYTWAYGGTPQEGSVLVGLDGAASGHWIDSWHMGKKGMACTGPAPADGTFRLTGAYAAPPGPDWGWRIDLTPGPDSLRMGMTNVSPEGEESPAVEAVYVRA
ncbi:MAG: hypothetical protein AVDCRST_MAG68-3562 [uncultured Gemmatimonadetes bacterium]|uniref:DUF1579 domain-containing protein n=1 Tax=uncultured Gemmatimonadota bacterium TaxID=203437 RepID=A0A6J4M5C6_9BACT|nr:MAG: hypothetical protein AVDCRST_MAG68-3562 [uncultured Gemmatimonadota bacterium]